MATGQTVLDLMEGLDRELRLQAAEADVTLGLKLLNAAQDYFESVAALQPNLFGDTTGTVTTSTDTETTSFPSGVMRLDRLQYLDPDTSRPAWDLERITPTGGHFAATVSPILASSANITGKPVRYWTDGTNIYWDPLPDATHTIRWYGFQSASDITAGGTFAYPDMVMLPMASFASRLFQIGKGDNDTTPAQLASELFEPVILTLSKFNRDRVRVYDYRFVHDA